MNIAPQHWKSAAFDEPVQEAELGKHVRDLADNSALLSAEFKVPASAPVPACSSTVHSKEPTKDSQAAAGEQKSPCRACLPSARRGKERCFTVAEVQEHNQRDDCWIMAHGRVYDVTSFIDTHPGGAMALVRRAGKDASRDFDFHRSSGKQKWQEFCIGKLEQDRTCSVM